MSDPPATAFPGGTFLVTDTTRNYGMKTAKASTTRYYLSPTQTRSKKSVLLTGVRSVDVLVPGANSQGSVTVTLPTKQIRGTYCLLACADDLNKLNESDETNNCIASSTTVDVVP